MFTNTAGMQNTANGTFALFSNDTGNLNTAVGRNALVASVNGNSNTAIGRDALQATPPAALTRLWERMPELILPLATITSISAILVLLLNQA